ncbi:MAG: hypothetical protein KOO62_08325 [candidate division Zixibacteria bacterium]|nr:hypothetical protein [candidate division Zixibacteria bacterium]
MRLPWALALLTIIFCTANVFSQRVETDERSFATQSTTPPYCIVRHDIGRLQFGITNFGMVGIGEGKGVTADCLTGKGVGLGLYPRGSGNTCFYKGGLWVGAVVGNDTLVSVGAELNNQAREFHPVVPMIRRSTLDVNSPEVENANAEQEFIAIYVDTFTSGVPNSSFDPIDYRPHLPLGIEVIQRSFAWSYAHTDDFVLIDYKIKNIGTKYLKDVYVGLYWDPDVYQGGANLLRPPDPYGRKNQIHNGQDDQGGFLSEIPFEYRGCDFIDTVAMIWTADANGKPSDQNFLLNDVTALMFLGSFPPNWNVAFNWWSYNYSSTWDIGPQTKQDYRLMGNGTGTPYGDRNKYAMLSSGDIDYDPVYAFAIQPIDQKWVQPRSDIARDITRGFDFQGVLSNGPFDLQPGASLTIPFAYVGGQGIHQSKWDYDIGVGYYYWPDHYLAQQDFSDLMHNAMAAGRAYDTPGLDSDGDGYAGDFMVCNDDTFYYRGDGTPDLNPEAPPPAPKLWVSPVRNGVRIRFNGWKSETTPDIFSSRIDFEGYHVFIARDDREDSFALLASYDRRDYDKYVYVIDVAPNQDDRYLIVDDPFTLEELRCLYSFSEDKCSDSAFDPLLFTRLSPYVHSQFPDSLFFFAKHNYNQYDFGVTTGIRKLYPDEPVPVMDQGFEPEQLTEDGYPKYYEYEYIVEDLLPTVPYWVSITSFDFGSRRTGLQSLESDVLLNATEIYPNTEWDESPNEIGQIYVYPNPYRQDDQYRQRGMEGRGEWDRSRDRVRRITFANLPARCWIRIFSLDGDLIKEIWHNEDADDPNSAYAEWDLISRNTQLVVSGLYYWIVESEDGQTQIGKLAILL